MNHGSYLLDRAAPLRRPNSLRLKTVLRRCLDAATSTSVRALSAFVAGALLQSAVHAQVAFDLDFDPAMDARAAAGFRLAAQHWSSLLSDPITVSVSVRFSADARDVGQADPTILAVDYATYLAALGRDQTSVTDAVAFAARDGSDQIRTLINRTAENPHGRGSDFSYLDDNYSANNLTVALTQANARALGLYQAQGGERDATITLRSNLPYDFDPSDGIDGRSADFVGIAIHELGHALGFISGNTLLDESGLSPEAAFSEDDLTYISSLDLFRYSRESTALGLGVIDWSADAREKFFSFDGGATLLAPFSTGTVYGDGEEASHWKTDLNLGAMDPRARAGGLIQISTTDLVAFDAIGYDLRPVPEPSTYGLAGVTVLLIGAVLRRRREKPLSHVAHHLVSISEGNRR